MTAEKTPGVYISGNSAYPNMVVHVASAVPARVGSTEKAWNGSRSLKGQPLLLSSMKELETCCGAPVGPLFDIVPSAARTTIAR
jgi:phage tail sheath protein FI